MSGDLCMLKMSKTTQVYVHINFETMRSINVYQFRRALKETVEIFTSSKYIMSIAERHVNNKQTWRRNEKGRLERTCNSPNRHKMPASFKKVLKN